MSFLLVITAGSDPLLLTEYQAPQKIPASMDTR